MENVVYILGAGFSAPLGLPVMSNFIEVSKNLYASDNNKYKHFGRVFDNIRKRLAYVTLFYKTNLDNIEEVLSILEMERLVGRVSKEEANDYIKFIVDVIQYFTPSIEGFNDFDQVSQGLYRVAKDSEKMPEYQLRNQIIRRDISSNYGNFVLHLFNGEIVVKGVGGDEKANQFSEFEIQCEIDKNPSSRYSVITLNYDLVLENYAKYFSSVSLGTELKFIRSRDRRRQGLPYLVKLHGSVDNQVIIPPTWNKTITPQIDKEWETAYRLLSSANHIRIIGYSLPDSDAYVRYLLKAGILKSENLKRIDVLCKDEDGSVKMRYDSFITLQHPKYRFCNGDVTKYLGYVGRTLPMESQHEAFYEKYEQTLRGELG